jgi:GTP cyclohydrolase IA
MNISESIRERLKTNNASFNANDYIGNFIFQDEIELLQKEVELRTEALLRSLVIDIDNDHNTQETAKRLAKMYINEVFAGRYFPKPKITEFPNVKNLDEIYILSPIMIRTTCSHHFVPIIGELSVGVIPSSKVIGISKFVRLAEWIFARGHIQEEAVIMLADEIEELIKPIGLAIIFKAEHFCMNWRGVKQSNTQMINSIMRGAFRTCGSARQEFFDLIKGRVP